MRIIRTWADLGLVNGLATLVAGFSTILGFPLAIPFTIVFGGATIACLIIGEWHDEESSVKEIKREKH